MMPAQAGPVPVTTITSGPAGGVAICAPGGTASVGLERSASDGVSGDQSRYEYSISGPDHSEWIGWTDATGATLTLGPGDYDLEVRAMSVLGGGEERLGPWWR